MAIDIWTEKHRPQELDEYVWRDPVMHAKVVEWLAEGAIPHLILSGKSGLGKTSLAKLMLRQLGVPKGDILEINASKERKIDEVQDRVTNFCSTYTMIDNEHGIKYVLFEEADSMSLLAQKFLRAELESNVNHVRFIFTCNYKEKINTAIIGRCQHFHFEALQMEEFVIRLSNILEIEKVKYSLDDLIVYIENAYPDLRKCINMVQQSTVAGVLTPMHTGEGRSFDYLVEVTAMFQNGQHKAARDLIVEQATVDEYPEIFRFMYQNLELWGKTADKQDDALLLIRDAIYRDAIVSDREISLSATLCELARLGRS
jgi:replication factor C small subunit